MASHDKKSQRYSDHRARSAIKQKAISEKHRPQTQLALLKRKCCLLSNKPTLSPLMDKSGRVMAAAVVATVLVPVAGTRRVARVVMLSSWVTAATWLAWMLNTGRVFSASGSFRSGKLISANSKNTTHRRCQGASRQGRSHLGDKHRVLQA